MRSESASDAPAARVPEGRKNVAHGVSRGCLDGPPLSPSSLPSPGGATESNGVSSVAPPGLEEGGGGGAPAAASPRLTPWATVCRPSGAGTSAVVAVLALLTACSLLTGCTSARLNVPAAV